jgi:hypothetical protein
MARIVALLLAAQLAAGEALAQSRPGGAPAARPAAPSAPSAPRPAGRVSITMLVVHATDSERGIDPRLESLASSFRYFKYAGYRLLSTQKADVAEGGDASFTIDGGRKVEVTLLSRDDARARVRVQMSNGDGKLLDTTVSINRDGTFIVAGPKYKDGILMLPLRASY